MEDVQRLIGDSEDVFFIVEGEPLLSNDCVRVRGVSNERAAAHIA